MTGGENAALAAIRAVSREAMEALLFVLNTPFDLASKLPQTDYEVDRRERFLDRVRDTRALVRLGKEARGKAHVAKRKTTKRSRVSRLPEESPETGGGK